MPNVRPSLDTLVCEAIEIADADARAAYLKRACGDDQALREQVAALVVAHFQAGSFLEQPACPPVSTDPHTPAPAEAASAQPAEGPGALIGPYKLLERIGEGGMGAVYVAEQTKPVRRRVAVKVIKPGMDSTEVVARFEAERQALALMDHPHIAKVLDAGTTQAGRPYFVMELVRGLPITEYCDQARLPAGRLLRLFAQVCRAVQHAHQKGVIHRDLKPSNILVTMHDGEPVPKVIDFGVAKALNQRLSDRTVYTRLTQMVGTPLYMSPEQAELSALDVDTRSDLYSLGVLLYELLTGTTPFDPEAFRKAGFDEMRRMIREDEPPRPSQRVSTLGAQARSTLSARRGLDDRQLRRLLHGDLDWVVMKALEKDRNRRYESAGAFAADVERYLADKPVQARPPSVAYRLRKFARRHRTGLAAAAVLSLALLAVVGILGWSFWDAETRRKVADQAVVTALADADEWERRGRWSDALAAMDRAAVVAGADERLRSLAQRRRDALALARRLEEIRLEMTTVRDDRFDTALGDRLYPEAFRGYGVDVEAHEPQEVARRLPEGPIRLELVGGLEDWMQARRAVRPAADRGWERLLEAARAADPDPWRTQVRDAWARRNRPALKRLADALPLDQLRASSIQLLCEPLTDADAVAVLRRAQQVRPGDIWINHSLAHRLARMKPPQHGEALGYFRAAVALSPESPGTLLNLGLALDNLDRLDEAAAAYERAIRLKPDYAAAYINLGNVLKSKGKLDEAVARYQAALRVKPDAVMGLRNLGTALAEQGKPDEGLALLEKAIDLKPDYAVAHGARGDVLLKLKKLGEAVEAYEAALRLEPDQVKARLGLGTALTARGSFAEAIAAYRGALRYEPQDVRIHLELSRLYCATDAWADGGLAALEAIRIRPDFAEAHCNLGHALQGLGRFPDALAAFRRGHELGPRQPGWEYPSAQWVRRCEALVTADLACWISPNLLSRLTAVCRTEGVWRNEHNPLSEGTQMALRNWLRRLSPKHTTQVTRRRLGVERLEDRSVPAVGFLSALGIGSGADGGHTYDMAVDAAGNSYLTGFFIGTMDFDPAQSHPGNADLLTARGGDDIFVAKYAPDNSLVWARRMGGDVPRVSSTIVDTGRALAVDGAGNVYLTGRFEGTGDFGSFTLTANGKADGFLAKLSPAGAVLWAKRWGTALEEEGKGVGVDVAGNVYALGARVYDTSGYVNVHDNHGWDVLKFSPTGSAVWTKSVNTRSRPIDADLAVNPAGEVFVAGQFLGSVDFDPGAKTKYFSSGAGYSGFVLKLTSAGNYGWASTFYAQASSGSAAQSIALDGSGNVIVGGYYNGSVDFNPSTATTTLPGTGGGFIAKLTSGGGLTWARALEKSSGSTFVYGLAVDSAGAIYATGSFSGTVDFDPGSGSQMRSSVGPVAYNSDIFVLKLDAAGTYAWAETFGSTEVDTVRGVAVDSAGTVYLGGSYRGTIDFDPDPAGTYELTTLGRTNLFLVKLSQR